MADFVLSAKLTAEADGFRGEMRVAEQDVERFGRAMRQSGTAARRGARATDRYGREARQAGNAARAASRHTQTFGASVANLQAAIAALSLGLAAREFFRMADSATRMESRLRNVTESSAELVRVQEQLFDLSQETRSSLESTVELYARVARSSDQLGVSQRDLLQVSEAVNKAIQISGATAAEASAGVIQFAQGLASGELRGEELRSVMEQLPRLAEALVDGLEGVDNIGALREMAEDGRLTADKVLPALLSQLDELRREFDNIDRTTSQAFTQLRNELLRSIGIIDDGSGASRDLAGALDDIRATVATPEFREGMTSLVGLLTGLVGLGGDAVAALGELNQEISDLTGGVLRFGDLSAFGPLSRLGDKLFSRSEEELRAELESRQETIRSLLEGRRRLVANDADDGVLAELDRQIETQRLKVRRLKADLKSLQTYEGRTPQLSPADAAPARAGGDDGDDGANEDAAKTQARIDKLFDEAAAMRRITLAYREGEEAVREAEDAREAMQILQKFGTDLTEEEAKLASKAAYAYVEQKRALDAAREAQRERTRAEEEAARAHQRTLDEIRRAQLDLMPGYKRMRAEAEAWREEALAGLDEQAAGYREFAAEIEAIYRERLLRASTAWHDGAVRAMRDYAEEAADAGSFAERATTRSFRSMEDAIVEFATTGKASFSDLVNSMIADLVRLQVRQSVTGPLAEIGSDFLGSLFGGGSSAYTNYGALPDTGFRMSLHGGGTIGAAGGRGRTVPDAVFAGAPRYHGGGRIGMEPLARDEQAIIAREGEGVFTPRQMNTADALFRAVFRAAAAPRTPPVEIHVHENARGVQTRTEQGRGEDGRFRLDVFVEEVDGRLASRARRGQSQFDTALAGKYGLDRGGALTR